LALDSHPVYEEDDMGQTTVNTNHEIIARDPRFASPLQRIQRLNEALILRRRRNHDRCTRISQNLSTLTRLQREKKEELKQNRRTGAFPMWAEPAPRGMQDKEREGIRPRFVDSDESQSVSRARYVTGYEGQILQSIHGMNVISSGRVSGI